MILFFLDITINIDIVLSIIITLLFYSYYINNATAMFRSRSTGLVKEHQDRGQRSRLLTVLIFMIPQTSAQQLTFSLLGHLRYDKDELFDVNIMH